MPKISMNVGLGEDGAPHLTYTPRESADFAPVDIVIPPLGHITYTAEDIAHPNLALERISDEIRFRAEAELKVRDCCGFTACKASLRLASGDMVAQPELRIIVGATLDCDDLNCPLIDPPESGDREPLAPAPQPPSLEADIEVPMVG